MMFENRYFESVNVNYSRIIASFVHSGGNVFDTDLFKAWLEHIGFLDHDQILEIIEFATCGKLELEIDAKRFIKAYEHKNDEE